MNNQASCPDCGKPVAIHGNRCYSCAQRKRFSTTPRQTKQQEINTLRQQLADLKAALAGVGLPEDAGVAGLIRHHRGNAMAAGAIEQLGADLKEISDLKAERDRYRQALEGVSYLADFGNGEEMCWCSEDYFRSIRDNVDAPQHCEACIQASALLSPSPIAPGEAPEPRM